MTPFDLDLTVRTLQLSNWVQNMAKLYPQGGLRPRDLSQVDSAVHKSAAFLVIQGPEMDGLLADARQAHVNYLNAVYAALLRVAKCLSPSNFVKVPHMTSMQALEAIQGKSNSMDALKAAKAKAVMMRAAMQTVLQFKAGVLVKTHLLTAAKQTAEIISALGSIRRNSLQGWLQIMQDLGCQDASALTFAQEMLENTCSRIGLGRVATLCAKLTTMPDSTATGGPEADVTADATGAGALKNKARRAVSRSAKPEDGVGASFYSTSIRLNSTRVLALPQVNELYNRVLRMTTGKDAQRKKLDSLVSTAFAHKYAAPGEELSTAKGLVDEFVAGLTVLQKDMDEAARVQQEKEIKESKTKTVQALRGMGQLLKVLKENPELLNEA